MLLKNCFVILCSKGQTFCLKKNVACRLKLLCYILKNVLLVKHDNGHYRIHQLVLKLFILEAEECDVTQFNQLNLNSPFSHQAIN